MQKKARLVTSRIRTSRIDTATASIGACRARIVEPHNLPATDRREHQRDPETVGSSIDPCGESILGSLGERDRAAFAKLATP
jgi:hypothetical protein